MTTAFQIAVASAVASGEKTLVYSTGPLSAADFPNTEEGAQLVANLNKLKYLTITTDVVNSFNQIELTLEKLTLGGIITSSFNLSKLNIGIFTLGTGIMTDSFRHSKIVGCQLLSNNEQVIGTPGSFLGCTINVQTISVSNEFVLNSFNGNKITTQNAQFVVSGNDDTSDLTNSYTSNKITGSEKVPYCNEYVVTEKTWYPACNVAFIFGTEGFIVNVDIGLSTVANTIHTENFNLTGYFSGLPFWNLKLLGTCVTIVNSDTVASPDIMSNSTLYFSNSVTITGVFEGVFYGTTIAGKTLQFNSSSGGGGVAILNTSNVNVCNIYLDGPITNILPNSTINAHEFKFPYTGQIASTHSILNSSTININKICIGLTEIITGFGTNQLCTNSTIVADEFTFITDPIAIFTSGTLAVFTNTKLKATQLHFAKGLVYNAGTVTTERAIFELGRFKSTGNLTFALRGVVSTGLNLKCDDIIVAGIISNSFTLSTVTSKLLQAYSLVDSFGDSYIDIDEIRLINDECVEGLLDDTEGATYFIDKLKIGSYVDATAANRFLGLKKLDLDITGDYQDLVESVFGFTIKKLIVNGTTISVLNEELYQLSELKVLVLKGTGTNTALVTQVPVAVLQNLKSIQVCHKPSSAECALLQQYNLA